MFKVIQNPKTGKMETVEVIEKVTKETLAEAHRELKDMLDGNRQFHDDPYTPKAEDGHGRFAPVSVGGEVRRVTCRRSWARHRLRASPRR